MSTYSPSPQWHQAQIVLRSDDLHADLAFYGKTLGFDLQSIYPADDPRVAVLTGFGLALRLDRSAPNAPSTLCLQTRLPLSDIANANLPAESPSGTKIVIEHVSEEPVYPKTQHEFVVRQLRDAEPWVIGRAGMHYRDLIPSRLGGSIIASHIRIPEGGPVPDMVHYHTVGFQLIYCYQGWVKLVYEDQGPEFVLRAGDCVTQPPKIRHRVLEASDQLEVIEIGVPAEHVTTIDHELSLPTDTVNRERKFDGQTFCHNRANESAWTDYRLPGFKTRNTGIDVATARYAGVNVVKPLSAESGHCESSHDADILFGFVLSGELELGVDELQTLQAGSAFTVPPGMDYSIGRVSEDLTWLEVSLPGAFKTRLNQ